MADTFYYTIDDNDLSVRIYQQDNPIPVVFQPDWPSGEAWRSKEDAAYWAQLQCDFMIDREINPQPPMKIGDEPKLLVFEPGGKPSLDENGNPIIYDENGNVVQ
jgi:hypothetical protein